ncbi:hypothetical protein K2173_027703 [Erythroxylum novogranatense]|uniref:Uncharacterized protein n=1 Tax=Erythroxylum novogranatense TaxID=1862640 RepID=A0AAV8TZT2_9ROSI|nr:hypothetical protein K2173_027703 [Erythroxylum novogranatense]
MMELFLGLLVVSFLIFACKGQQNYSGLSALDCKANDETGPSSAFLYTCNAEQSCKAFLIFKSQASRKSVSDISALTSANYRELARINDVQTVSVFPLNQEVIIPVTCTCSGRYYHASTTFPVSVTEGTYYQIATEAYEGLTTCASLLRENPDGEYNLYPGMKLQVPLRCACPTKNQVFDGTKYLLTLPLSSDDEIADIAQRFKTTKESLLEANGLGENPDLHPDTTILVPLPNSPMSLNTSISAHKSKRKLLEIVALAAGCSFLVVSIFLAVVLVRRKRRKDNSRDSRPRRKWFSLEDIRVEIASFEKGLKVFEIEQVKKATDNFSPERTIKGSVYSGEFGGEIFAIKRMSKNVSKQVKILKRINHFNLIKLHGLCQYGGCYYLVFEYMKNGSLREWLSSTKRCEENETWDRRIQIAIDVANGLHYLHSFAEPAYVHKDIKCSNILLNSNLRAKIANFSLAREATTNETNHVAGTRGYMAPEYIEAGQVTPTIDVYAFGVVLLELITGRDAVFMQGGREVLLSKTIMSIMEKENPEAGLDSFIDPNLKGSPETEFALRLAKVSVACLRQEPASRPGMEEVVSSLLKIQADLKKSESGVSVISDTVSLRCP